MLLSNPAKFFCLSAYLTLILTGCFAQYKAENNTIPLISEAQSDLPFSAKEPEVYQAEIIVTSSGIERRMFVARNGTTRRSDFNIGESNQFSLLQTSKNYLIAKEHRTFAENTTGQPANTLGGPFDEFTSSLLHARMRSSFTLLGSEGNLQKYSVRLADSDTAEALIYVDEATGFPVKQEFYTLRGEERILQHSVEMRNFRLETDPGTFEIPAGFRQTSIVEVRNSLNGNDE